MPNTAIPLVVKTGAEGVPTMEGHTEIRTAFLWFMNGLPEAERPSAIRFEAQLIPAPMSKIGAQPFKHVPNEYMGRLLNRWSRRLKKLATDIAA